MSSHRPHSTSSRPRSSAPVRSTLFVVAALLHLSVCVSGQIPFKDVEYIFSFGDSYTASPSNTASLANVTSSNTSSPAWISYLASTLNNGRAVNQFYNFAQPGATISTQVIHSFGNLDLVGQTKEFLGSFVNRPSSTMGDNAAKAAWKGSNSLFTLWLGLEDLGYAYASGTNWIVAQPFMLTTFDQQIAALYSAGARNFLILSIPPVNRTPVATSFGPAAQATLKTAADFWNGRLIVYAGLLAQIYPGSTGVYFDTQPLFNTILNEPAAYSFENSKTVCPAYAAPSSDEASSAPECGAPLEKYFWKDSYHPSFAVHKYIAQEVISVLTTNSTSIPPMKNGLPIVSPSSRPSSGSPSSIVVGQSAATNPLAASNPTPTLSSFNSASTSEASSTFSLSMGLVMTMGGVVGGMMVLLC